MQEDKDFHECDPTRPHRFGSGDIQKGAIRTVTFSITADLWDPPESLILSPEFAIPASLILKKLQEHLKDGEVADAKHLILGPIAASACAYFGGEDPLPLSVTCSRGDATHFLDAIAALPLAKGVKEAVEANKGKERVVIGKYNVSRPKKTESEVTRIAVSSHVTQAVFGSEPPIDDKRDMTLAMCSRQTFYNLIAPSSTAVHAMGPFAFNEVHLCDEKTEECGPALQKWLKFAYPNMRGTGAQDETSTEEWLVRAMANALYVMGSSKNSLTLGAGTYPIIVTPANMWIVSCNAEPSRNKVSMAVKPLQGTQEDTTNLLVTLKDKDGSALSYQQKRLNWLWQQEGMAATSSSSSAQVGQRGFYISIEVALQVTFIVCNPDPNTVDSRG